MENDKKQVLGVTFEGPVTFQGPMFDIHDNEHVHIHNDLKQVETAADGVRPMPDRVQLARAIVACQPWFWGNSSYAVLYCLLKNVCGSKMSRATFAEMVEGLHYEGERRYVCTENSISRAFSDNPVFYNPITKWSAEGASKRAIRLLSELRRELQL